MKNFFKGISVSQIIAGALAAVTSFLLSAKIGIAGSVIGVAVGSIVSAVASQIYQNVLNESGKKLQENTPDDDATDQDIEPVPEPERETRVVGSDARHHGQLAAPRALSRVSGTPALRVDGTSPSLAALARSGKELPDSETKISDRLGSTAADQGKHDVPGLGDKNDATSVTPAAVSGKTSVMKPVSGKQNGKAISESGKFKGPGQHDGKMRTFESTKQKRLAIVVAVVSALVAVGISAGIISLATRGKGTDDVVRNIVTNSTTKNPSQKTDSKDTGNTSTDNSKKTDGTTKQNSGTTNQNNSGSTTDSGTQSGSNSNGSGTTSGSESSNSGSSSTGSGSTDSANSGSSNSGTTDSNNGTTGTTNGGTSSDSTGSTNGSNGSSSNGSSTGGSSTNGSTSGGSSTGTSGSDSTTNSQTGNGTSGTNSNTTSK
ncbi:hypothetical protein [Bifidobacterium sp. ESL0745]|uniref:hypothetical protein n=1 Tax=Bifidobacterium sp. ESL0745 TaxID=2983226 RepID=UPI0023F76BF9|nr:hypothetical protein [Bifidobacterium sp. ESL0745]MDF7664994.1 hypothetical protein [Bifidobacterium sp. ESL0745]